MRLSWNPFASDPALASDKGEVIKPPSTENRWLDRYDNKLKAAQDRALAAEERAEQAEFELARLRQGLLNLLQEDGR